MEASLYIHIPFCAQKCDYCDFYSVPTTSLREVKYDRFCLVLLEELRQNIEEFSIDRVPTLYIGGGTPSLLGARYLETLLASLYQLLPNWPEECTLEANPESLDESMLQVCKDRGVSRLSLGIQTLNDQSRKAVHRAGSSHHCLSSLERVLYFYPENLSIDLMTGLPFQTLDTLVSDLEILGTYPIAHVSLYALTVEEGTPLAQRLAAGEQMFPGAEYQEELWLAGRDWLVSHGFEQYEVSNFARSGAICKHNMRYWQMQSWIGCGPSASSTVIDEKKGTALRRTVAEDVDEYCIRGPRYQEEPIDRETLQKECLMMGFRTIQEPDPKLFEQRFGISVEAAIPRTLEFWRRRGLCEKHRPALTPQGLRYANAFIVECFQELEEER